MIPVPCPSGQSWRQELTQAITDPADLLRVLELDPGLLTAAQAAGKTFPLRAPRGFVARMRKGDSQDPLLRQVLPLDAETMTPPGFTNDPVGETQAMPVPGLLHKYHGRALLIATGACAIHCRYCFRRAFPYARAGLTDWRSVLSYLNQDASLSEVILSGGDPLVLSDGRLARMTGGLDAIPHLRRLRIHSRLPVVLPERVDRGLLAVLKSSRLQPVMVLHVNHPQEIDEAAGAAINRLRCAGVTLFNQAVLLKGVNDSAPILAELSETLFSLGVIPYYLHLLDRVRGAAHFEVAEDQAAAIMAALRRCLPGYLTPRLVREQAGAAAKTPVL